MVSSIYYGSPRQAQLKAEETLPAKLDLIIEQLNIRERVKDEQVAIKLHLGNNVGYSVIHPVFVRKVVQAVKDAQYLFSRCSVQIAGRLVGENDRRPCGQGTGNGHTLLLTARQLVWPVVHAVL